MLQQVLDVFGVVPDRDFALMQPNQTLGGLTSRAIAAIDKYLDEEKPDIVMVQGDTTTVLAGASAVFSIPVAHIKAGLDVLAIVFSFVVSYGLLTISRECWVRKPLWPPICCWISKIVIPVVSVVLLSFLWNK